MAKTQWILLLVTFFISCASLMFIIISFATNYWITAEAINEVAVRNSEINYGLFSGSLTRYLLASESVHKLTVICLYDENACIYSCQSTPEMREDEVRRIIDGNALLVCPIARSFGEKTIESNNTHYFRADNRPNEQYISPALWFMTVFFLSVTTLFAFISAIFAIINIIFNPIEPILSILGLYIWNGIASGSAFLTLMMWGILFASYLTENIAITDTLRLEATYVSNGLAKLGYSYWLLWCPAVAHLLNIGLLLWRKRIIEMEPPPPTINIDNNDFKIRFY